MLWYGDGNFRTTPASLNNGGEFNVLRVVKCTNVHYNDITRNVYYNDITRNEKWLKSIGNLIIIDINNVSKIIVLVPCYWMHH